jgi:hypothetical protein
LGSVLASKASFGALTELLADVVLAAAEAAAAEAGRLAARKPAASTATIILFDRPLLECRRMVMSGLLFLDPVRMVTRMRSYACT